MEVDDAAAYNTSSTKSSTVLVKRPAVSVATTKVQPPRSSDVIVVNKKRQKIHNKTKTTTTAKIKTTVKATPTTALVVPEDYSEENNSLRLVVSSDEDHDDNTQDNNQIPKVKQQPKEQKTLSNNNNNTKITKESPILKVELNSDEEKTVKFCAKRKRYEVSNLGSQEILLGCDEASGETCLISESAAEPEIVATLQQDLSLQEQINNNNNMAESKNSSRQNNKKLANIEAKEDTKQIEKKEDVMIVNDKEEQEVLEHSEPAAKRLKKNSPAHATVLNVATKSSPNRKVAEATTTIKQPPQTHIVADVDERSVPQTGNVVASTKTRSTASGKKQAIVSAATTSEAAAATPPTNKPLTAQDDFYKKPFEYGWKRELVWRATSESGRERADVYFISPAGKKIRTRHDIPPLLQGDLKMEHFCWLREPVGVGPEYETVRNAKPNPNRSNYAAVALAASTSVNTPVTGKRMPKPKGPKGASPPPEGWTPTRALKVNNAALNSRSGGMGGSTPQYHRSSGSTSTRSTGGSSSNKKKYANDIENDLKQINESIRNSLPSQPSLTKLEVAYQQQQHQQQHQNAVVAVSAANQFYGRNFFANMSYAFDSLLIILKYLKIHERMRFGSVCKLWYAAANSRSVWQTVRMKNSKVCDWAGCAAALQRNGTKHLDLRKMLFSSVRADEMWADFSTHIGNACFLENIDLCRCPARVVEALFKSNKNLRILNAMTINDDALNLEHIDNLSNLVELRLRTIEPAVLTHDLAPLGKLTKLTHFSLTAISSLGSKGIEALKHLKALRSLELGECGGLDETFAQVVLPQLTQLQRLRLENGQDTGCCTLAIMKSASKLKQLKQLELVNFDVRPTFEELLQQFKTLSKLLIIPTYLSQSATTNQTVLDAVQKISPQLKVFTWGVTVELLRVTALYVDQCEESSKKEKHNFNECIPVLKPVPGAAAVDDHEMDADISGSSAALSTAGDNESTANDVPQIEILPLDKVERILAANMPNTKFQIVKVPYHATCKQQLVE